MKNDVKRSFSLFPATKRYEFTRSRRFRVVRVRTLLFSKVPRCKDSNGKDLFIVAQAVHGFSNNSAVRNSLYDDSVVITLFVQQ